MAPPTIHEEPDRERSARRVREEIRRRVHAGDRIAVPTGRTPSPLYRAVLDDATDRALWGSLRYLQLDEYIAPPPGTESFTAALARQLFDPLGVPPEARGAIVDPTDPDEPARLDRLATPPPRLCLLGLGRNGHIAFNEPGDRTPGYHRVTLAPDTVATNFPPDVAGPVEALTIGLDQLAAAGSVVLWVPQPDKQALLDRVLASGDDPALPATALLGHPDLTIVRGPAAQPHAGA